LQASVRSALDRLCKGLLGGIKHWCSDGSSVSSAFCSLEAPVFRNVEAAQGRSFFYHRGQRSYAPLVGSERDIRELQYLDLAGSDCAAQFLPWRAHMV
tara:strand:+ start:231 stop:524 length:294 start_codon:yes stop_codon:yes gene_type:complete